LVIVAPVGPNAESFVTVVTYGRFAILCIFRINSTANKLRILAVEGTFGEGAAPDAPAGAGRR